jgi:ribulose-5-phosphate 4-epimerase/fuculose-1-phosphate aldolase
MTHTAGVSEATEQLITACRHLAAAGLSPGSSGNVSVRTGGFILMTPTGSALGRVQPSELALLSHDGVQTAETARPRPSKELPLHLAAYSQRPDARAVVHLHSPYATAVSCLPAGAEGNAHLPALTPYRVMRLGNVPLVPYAAPGSADLACGVRQRVGDHPVLLLANHGSVIAAKDLVTALDLAEELETAAQLTLLLKGASAVPLAPEEIAALRGQAGRSGRAPSPSQ